MLTGRESLVRLIGRRRRSPLPASLAALLSPTSHQVKTSPEPPNSPLVPPMSFLMLLACLQADLGGAGEAAGVAAAAAVGSSSGGSAGGGAEWVACPVCGESIRGSDYCVNTHLDICLTRGTKRKLTQSTLLDFRFSKKTTVEPTLDSLNNDDEAENSGLDGDISNDRAFFLMNSDTTSSKDSATPVSLGCLYGSLGISNTHITCIPLSGVLPNMKKDENDDAVENGSSCMLPTGLTSGSSDACADMASSTTVTVDTVIVGRRFHENIELQQGVGITVLRDPQNAKDSDAIKGLNVGRCLDTCLESWVKFWRLYWTNIMLTVRELWLVCLNNSLIMFPSSLLVRIVKMTIRDMMI